MFVFLSPGLSLHRVVYSSRRREREREKRAGRQTDSNRYQQTDVGGWRRKWQWRECRWVHSGLQLSGDLGNLVTLEQVRLTSSRPGSKVVNWDIRVIAELWEFDSETSYFLISVTPASFWPSLLPSAYINRLSVCLSVRPYVHRPSVGKSNLHILWMNLLFLY